MNIRSILSAMVFVPVVVAVAAESAMLPGFGDAVAKTGNPYCEAIAVVTNDANAVKYLQGVISKPPSDSETVRCARIILARIEHPEVFADFASELRKWKGLSGERPGFLSGSLMQFVKRGPESKYVEECVRDREGKVVFEPSGSSNGKITLKGMRPRLVKLEKYTDAEVQAGIARNTAARQAVLEHFLKFLNEGDAYEQSEMVELVSRLWGRERITRAGDHAIIDHVQDADALIAGVFHDVTRPATARMRAAFYLADAKPVEVRAFMLNVVINTPTDAKGRQNEDVVNRALAYLESAADANTLAVMKNQTNGPAWKREKIENASHVIEGRLSANQKNK